MKNIYAFAIVVFFLVASCREAGKTIPVAVADSTPDSIPVKTIPRDTSIKVWEKNNIPVVLKRWETFWKSKNENFDLDDFYFSGRDKFDPYNPQPIDKLPGRNDTVSYPFSPDSTLRLDVYSYYGNSEGGEPDDAVFLVDVKRKTRYTVCYTGTDISYEDGGWIDNHSFIITGHQKTDDGKLTQAFYAVYNLDKKTVSYFNSKLYHSAKASDYIRYRLKQR